MGKCCFRTVLPSHFREVLSCRQSQDTHRMTVGAQKTSMIPQGRLKAGQLWACVGKMQAPDTLHVFLFLPCALLEAAYMLDAVRVGKVDDVGKAAGRHVRIAACHRETEVTCRESHTVSILLAGIVTGIVAARCSSSCTCCCLRAAPDRPVALIVVHPIADAAAPLWCRGCCVVSCCRGVCGLRGSALALRTVPLVVPCSPAHRATPQWRGCCSNGHCSPSSRRSGWCKGHCSLSSRSRWWGRLQFHSDWRGLRRCSWRCESNRCRWM